MLLTEFSCRKQQAIARELKKYIEQENRLIKESELRQLLNKYDINANLKEITNLFKSFYVEKTVEKLVSSIQLSVVWDTSLVSLEINKLYELFHNPSQTNIFISSVMKELEQKVSETPINNSRKFKYLYYSILSDANSEHSIIVDYESNNSYTDDEILQFAQEKMYHIYTCDYTMGLRAKSRKIDAIIFNKINETDTPKYTPTTDGKNIIITSEIVKSLKVEEVIKIATLLEANKFILPFEFIETLESEKNNALIREYVAFFVFDEKEDYTLFASREDGSDYSTICKKYNALVLTKNTSMAINLKKNHIPYYFILNQYELSLIKKINMEVNEDFPNSSNNEPENNETLNSNEEVTSVQLSKIPNYNPFSNTVKYNPIGKTNEKIWVLNGSEKEVPPTGNFFPTQSYTALPGFYVIHGINNMDGTYSITIYQIIEKNSFKTGQILGQYSFVDETEIPKKYRHYAAVLKRST